ncbi:MAG TPA: hypothetical protein VFL54_06790 [Gammaproteobacteria bacterium]|nr:hypothetical protein [Gammaproteobacteria bacterium]
MAIRNLLSVRQFSDKHPAWSQSALRNLIFQAQPRQSSKGEIPGNGLAPAIVRVGSKVLIDEDQFFAWVDAQQGAA